MFYLHILKITVYLKEQPVPRFYEECCLFKYLSV